MPALLLAVFTLAGFAPGFFALQADKAVIAVTNLEAGEVLRGIVQIQGTVQADQFTSYEVSFAYAGDTSGAWFLIEEGSQPVQDGILASWDTSRITDGDYRLRVQVTQTGGNQRELIVPDIHVRNYTAVEPTETRPVGITAPPGSGAGTLEPTIPAPSETPTAPMINPGSLTKKDFLRTLGCGAGASVMFFVVLGLYLVISRRARRG